jgi:hypothetical protein
MPQYVIPQETTPEMTWHRGVAIPIPACPPPSPHPRRPRSLQPSGLPDTVVSSEGLSFKKSPRASEHSKLFGFKSPLNFPWTMRFERGKVPAAVSAHRLRGQAHIMVPIVHGAVHRAGFLFLRCILGLWLLRARDIHIGFTVEPLNVLPTTVPLDPAQYHTTEQ